MLHNTGDIDSTLQQTPAFTVNGVGVDTLMIADTSYIYYWDTLTSMLDSIISTPVEVINFYTTQPTIPIDTLYYFPAGFYNMIFDSIGNIIDSIYVNPTGLLINSTGGNDLTLFEVDQSVNKIRAEVDPEAEIIFGAIKDEKMTGKIRVSIVATALDGYKTEDKTVLNMVSRIHNRNTGYSENLFSHNPRVENNALNSIEGATALKLDESYQLDEQEISNSNVENQPIHHSFQENLIETENVNEDLPTGVSIESASYMENNNLAENEIDPSFSEKRESAQK